MRVAFHTLGCRLNQFETEGMRLRVETDLPAAEVVGWADAADVYVINSCAVTARAEQKCRQMARAVKRKHPSARVVVAGCYAQLSGDGLSGRDEIDAVLGNEEKRALPDHLPRVVAGEDVVEVGRYRRGQSMAAEWIDSFGDYSRATIKVQEGCDMRCTFCAIWRARGPSRSRPPRDVVEQARKLAAHGYEEIVLAGVHVGHYGRDLEHATDLVDLLHMLLEVLPETVRIRLSSIDPGEVDLRLARALVDEPRLCRYLHLPLQSGADTVLRRMRRAYSAGYYERLVRDVAALDPDFGFGADVIVGFPGETEAEFEATRSLLERLPIHFYHVFPYSDRANTAAERMGDKVPRAVAMERAEILRAQGRAKREDFLHRHVGRRWRGIVEGAGTDDGLSEVMLDDYATVWIVAAPELVRRTVEVHVTALDERGRLRGRRAGHEEAHRSPSGSGAAA